MTEIRFYHLQRTPEDNAIPAIAYKAWQSGKHIIIKAADEPAVEKLNTALWTFRAEAFLPHGSAADKFDAQQPVYLTAGNDKPNEAKNIILSAAATNDAPGSFDLCCEMLDGRNEDQVNAARVRWKAYKEQGFEVSYWQETDSGWEKKA